jgi:FKBP-type peptidyl-prolyl cis-trans isomerase FkpA
MLRNRMCVLLLGVAAVAWGCQKKDASTGSPGAAGSPSAPPASSPATGVGANEGENAVAALGGAMGRQAAQQLKLLSLTPAEIEAFKKAFLASLDGKEPQYALEQYGPQLQARAQKAAAASAASEKQKSEAFRANTEKEPGAVKTPSGLIYKTLKPGSGASPGPTDVVEANYRGTLMDGTEFDASAKHGGAAKFSLNGVIPCWTEGLQRMKVGETARIVCPSEIAYGDQGRPPVIPPGATLVFDVELLGIQKQAAPPQRRVPQGR